MKLLWPCVWCAVLTTALVPWAQFELVVARWMEFGHRGKQSGLEPRVRESGKENSFTRHETRCLGRGVEERMRDMPPQ
ncbi:hypothetical protein TREES_T100020393 [Tupaia chinensis]|uniref:Secreted protein n=1 Tax=Tupaia chinensis TaxID=246437 RepID=L9KYJ8_TUPCH|nr:hypothetical protein TREES_T100020393 [Tupaia chinensis]